MNVAFMLLFFSAILLTLVSMQVPKSHARMPLTSSKSISTPFPTKHPTAHNIKITFPAEGKKVPIGKSLMISGVSAGNINATYINCHVSIIVNGIKPYLIATASGPNGSNDYSKWIFTLTPTSGYPVLKVGQNKITAKYSCANSPTSLSHYSVNVTGVNINRGNIPKVK